MTELLLLSLATATLSVTVTKATLFGPFRFWVESRSRWLGELVSCFYCFNHWAAVPLVASTVRGTVWEILMSWLAVVAGAGLISGLIIRLFSAVQQSEELRKLYNEVNQLQSALVESRKKIEELSRKKR